MTDPLLRMEQVAERLNITVQHAYRLVNRGDIQRVKFGHRSVRVSEQALAEYIAEHTRPARRTRSTA